MGSNYQNRAQFTDEIARRGALVVERYLDGVTDRLGKQLKLLCRAERLPVLSRVVWELDLPAEHGTWMMCESKQGETVEHLIFSCPLSETQGKPGEESRGGLLPRKQWRQPR